MPTFLLFISTSKEKEKSSEIRYLPSIFRAPQLLLCLLSITLRLALACTAFHTSLVDTATITRTPTAAMVIGIIRPPPEIRAVADKTALFVSKNGRAFEHKILNSEKGKTPKFAFLHASSPFHAYYEDKIAFYERGGDDEEEKRREAEKKEAAAREEAERIAKEEAEKKKKRDARMKASAVDPVARVLLRSRAKIEEGRRVAVKSDETDQLTGPVPPPSLSHVALVAPSNLTPKEVEIIKLTAQYVALSGRPDNKRDNFMNNLTLREWTNPEFTFMQPRHAHFAYFTALVDGYRSFLPGGADYESMKIRGKKNKLSSIVMNEEKSREGEGGDDVIRNCLEAAAYRAEYERDSSNRKREALESAAGGGMLGGAGTIDWHDFVVVATIEFPEDEVVEAVSAPHSLRLAALNKEADVKEKTEETQEDEEMEESEEEGSDMEGSDDEDGEKLKVVSNYQPKVVSTKEITGDSSRTHIIDPITGKSIAIADMPEHMRIQLLDPKWAEERKRFVEKQRETNFVAGEDISANISRLAQARGDLFGMSQAELGSQKVDSEKRLMEANQLLKNQMQGPALPGVAQPPAAAGASMPPPPPPPQPMAALPGDGMEPAAKRAKIEEPQMNVNPAMMPPPAPPAPPAAIPGLPPPPPGMPPQFDPNAAAIPPAPPAPQQPAVLPEEDFIATLENPNEIYFCVVVPHDPSNSNWNFNGQTIDVTLSARSKIKDVKEFLKGQLGGMPMNKMQLKHPVTGFMNKDALSLAHFNVGPGMTIDLVPKTRGGRK